MSKTMFKVFALILYGLLSAGAIKSDGDSITDPSSNTADNTGQINEVAGYKKWTRANANLLGIIGPLSFG